MKVSRLLLREAEKKSEGGLKGVGGVLKEGAKGNLDGS